MSAHMKILLGMSFLGLLAQPGAAAGPVPSTALSLRVQYDDNLFLQDPAPLAPGQTAPALPARAGAFGTTVGASLGLAWQAGDRPLFAISIGKSYRPPPEPECDRAGWRLAL